MNITVTTDSTTTSARLHVAGDLDYATTDEFVEAASRLLSGQPGLHHLHLDFTDLTFCDSAGLSGLLLLHRRAAQAGVRLHLDHRPPILDRVLEVTGVLEYLTTAPVTTDRSASPTEAPGETEIG